MEIITHKVMVPKRIGVAAGFDELPKCLVAVKVRIVLVLLDVAA